MTVETNKIRRLDLWFTRIVPRLYITKEEWKSYLINGRATTKPYTSSSSLSSSQSPSPLPTTSSSSFPSNTNNNSCSSTSTVATTPNDYLFARFWDKLKLVQTEKIKGYFKDLEEHETTTATEGESSSAIPIAASLYIGGNNGSGGERRAGVDDEEEEEDGDRSDMLEDLLPQSDIFDSTDFVMFYSQGFESPEFLFDLLADGPAVTREGLERCGARAPAGGWPAAMGRAEFAAAAERDPDLRGCFGLIKIVRAHLADADAMLVSGRPMSGLLMKKTSTLEWVPRVVTVEGGFFWYSKSGAGDAAARVVPLEGAIIQRTCTDAENDSDNDGDNDNSNGSEDFGQTRVSSNEITGGSNTNSSSSSNVLDNFSESGFTFTVTVGSLTQEFMAQSDLEREAWMHALIEATRMPEDHRYASFSPVRGGGGGSCCSSDSSSVVRAKWFVDGHDYFAAVAKALRAARNDIFIAGWIISHALYLVRDRSPPSVNDRLDVILKRKASEGVKVFILAWNETKIAMDLGSDEMEQAFTSINNKNIHVIKHPASFPLYCKTNKTKHPS